ncbi:DUF397 domain-containing protein [Streptomyces acidicola]|uniref:DUF397 domain-containing protein n=1 Tax=Streptomyces acidicola TaxID=2596892 RepID=UPI00380F0599
MPELRWQKSSYSQEASACVYLAATTDTTLRLRESDQPDVALHAERAALAALIAVVKNDAAKA